MLSPDTGRWGLSIPASSTLASSMPASPSPMAVGSHRGRALCPGPLAAVPGADPNPSILVAIHTTVHHHRCCCSPRSAIFMHGKAGRLRPGWVPGASSPGASWGATAVRGAGQPEPWSRPTTRSSPGWEMKANPPPVNASSPGRLPAAGGWGRASAFCWSPGLRRRGWQIRRRTKLKFLIPRWPVQLCTWPSLSLQTHRGAFSRGTWLCREGFGSLGRAAPATPGPVAMSISPRSPLSLLEHPRAKPGAVAQHAPHPYTQPVSPSPSLAFAGDIPDRHCHG